ncbi:MAG: hypothetical protein V4613_10260 [Bacteroidota bacterium]
MFTLSNQVHAAKILPKSLKPEGPAGYMGLWDWGVYVGVLNQKINRPLIGNAYENKKIGGPFISAHLQESLLSNYFWATKQDKRFKFGIIETIEMGLGYYRTQIEVTAPNQPVTEPSSKLSFIFTYEGGIGGVYKINDKIDAGLSYYFVSISTFNNQNADYPHFAKLRLRYSHIMTEVSLLGKKAFDIKYLRKGTEDRSYTPYIGFSYTGWKENEARVDGAYSNKANYYYFTIGGIF